MARLHIVNMENLTKYSFNHYYDASNVWVEKDLSKHKDFLFFVKIFINTLDFKTIKKFVKIKRLENGWIKMHSVNYCYVAKYELPYNLEDEKEYKRLVYQFFARLQFKDLKQHFQIVDCITTHSVKIILFN